MPQASIQCLCRAGRKSCELDPQFISRIPLGRWGKDEEIGQLAVYPFQACRDTAVPVQVAEPLAMHLVRKTGIGPVVDLFMPAGIPCLPGELPGQKEGDDVSMNSPVARAR